MRTKTLLIVAASALAAAITSSQAQTVYSQNVVGYVNTTLPAGVYTLICNPLNSTANSVTNIFTSLQGGENILIWHGTGYYSYIFEGAGAGTSIGYQSDWADGFAAPPQAPNIPGDQTDTSDSLYWAPAPVINPGQGFFILNPNANETNTFTGTVVTTNSTTLPSGVYSLLSSAIPVGGNVTTNSTINLSANFAGGETMLVWHGTGYYSYIYEGAGAGTSIGYQSDWADGFAAPPQAPNIPGDQTDTSDSLYWAPAPSLSVGQGFFILNPNGNEQWSQTITNL